MFRKLHAITAFPTFVFSSSEFLYFVHCVFSQHTAVESDEGVLAGKTEVSGLHIPPHLEASLGHGCLHPGVFTATLPGCIFGTTH